MQDLQDSECPSGSSPEKAGVLASTISPGRAFSLPAKPKRKRAGMGKKVRFEIFKRDSFTCVYCGRKPPEVILNVDHVIPVAKGGTNDDHNLVTACKDCNAGKRDHSLTQLPHGHQETLEERRDKLEQLREISRLSLEQQIHDEEVFSMLSDYWVRMSGLQDQSYPLSSMEATTIRRFMKLLPPNEIMEAIASASSRFAWYESDKFRYFCGVCWNKIKNPDRFKQTEKN